MIGVNRIVYLLHLICICRESSALVQSPPRIVKQPPTDELLFQVAEHNNENDKPFIIECEAEGEPSPQFKWIKNGKHFDWQAYDDRIVRQPGRGTLVISVPRDEDLGQYQCFAYNVLGKATSNSVFVRKAELNSFKDASHIVLTAREGEPFRLTCEPPDGWPKPNVYWIIQYMDGGIKSINNSRLTLDSEGNLWFSNVTRNDASDDFYYACAATSVFRNDFKLGNKVVLNVIANGISASLNRHGPVKQYMSRKNEVALRGKKVELYCIYGGTPLPQIVWSKNGKVIQSSDRITQGNNGKSLIIKYVTFDDEGSYTCEASNGIGIANSYSINLHVIAVPYFTVEPQIKYAAADETVEFKCKASGVPEPQIKWIYNGKPISEAPPNPRRKVNRNSIVIEKLTKNDTGNYGCNATNSLGYVYKDVFLNVLALAPEITQPPYDMDTVDHETITMKCPVFGVPKPQVKWETGGKKLIGGRYKVLNNGDLQIQDVMFSDEGEYTCYASNKFGNVEASASLRIKEHTKITDAPEDYEVAAGKHATFRCNAVSDNMLTLQIYWLNGGQLIDFESDSRFVRSFDYSLTIFKTTVLDSGTYTCVAKTELDEATAQAILTVQDVPNAPELQGVICNKYDATIRWRPMGDNRAPILHYTIFYNTSFTPDIWKVASDSVPANDMTYNVPLNPWANYTFRVVAWNKIGKSLASMHSTVCTTQPEVPSKNPEHVEGKGTEPNNLVIMWNAMPHIEHGGPKFQYRVFFKRDIPGERYSVVEIPDWKKTKYTVNDQPTFQQYRIKVVAMNVLGEANIAPKEVIGYSGEDVPLEAPSNFTLVRVHSPTHALLSWNPVPLESVRGHFNGYKIEIWIDNDKFNNDPYHSDPNHRDILVNGDATSAHVSKLVPHTKNYARVLVFNDRYNGPPSQILSFETPEGVPVPVAFFEAIPMGSSAFFLFWKKPAQSNGILTGYNIYYQEVNGTKVLNMMSRLPQINSPDVFSAKLSGLKSDTKYRLHIKATTKAGEGESYFIERKTRVSGGHVPDVPTFTWSKLPIENGFATVKVDWVVNPNGKPGSHFYVKYRVHGEPTFQCTKPEINEYFLKIHGLTPNEDYELKVVAVDGSHETESAIEQVNTYVVVQSPPRIVKQPPTDELLFQVAEHNNENDKPFIIECEAEGEPSPQFKWIKNGKHFDWQAYDDRIVRQPGRGTLVISVPRDEDLGQYQCFAYNVLGKATSNSVFVRKAELNSFKDASHIVLTAREGEPFRLTCEPPDGWPKPNVYWIIQYMDGGIKSINNSRLTLDSEGNLWFSNVTRNDASDDFYYACAATSVFRNDFKLGNKVVLNVIANGISASLNRHGPVKQYMSRKNEVALRGKKVELYCIYGGTPLPQIVWSKNGKVIQSSDRITQGNNGKSLIIKYVTFDDEGSYTCEASNGIGIANSYSINLHVIAVPYFTVEPQIKYAAADETVEFKCKASGVPEPQIKWIYNGKLISEAPPNPRRKVSTNSIVIEKLTKNDTGNYGCNATNSLGYVYKDVFLNVLALAPEITQPPYDMDTVDHETITMKCPVFGVPKPQVKWETGGKKLIGGRYKVLNNGDLQIQDVMFSDEGEYTCYASNKFGNVEASATLRIKEHTKITDAPEDYEVAAGTHATFRCNAVSDNMLALQIYWLNGGQLIDFESDSRFVRSSDYSLTIFKTTALDSGTYTCVAKTELDEATAQAILTVQDVPNAPELQGVICNKYDATIRWRPMGDNRAPILHYTIFYNTSFTPDIWKVASDSVPANDMTYNVPLNPWANYTFRVVAWNKIGKSLASMHSTVCTTQPEVPSKNPELVEGKGTEPNNLVIMWNAMPQIEHGGPKFQYRVFFKRDIPGERYSVVEIPDWKKTKYTVNDQPTFQQYRIKVVAMNVLGEANIAPKEVIGYSGEDVPLEAPSNFTLVRVHSPTHALLSWNPVPLESVRGHFNGYKIEIWIDNDKFNNDPYHSDPNHREILVNGDATSAHVSKLVPHTKTYARVLVFNDRYNGPPSQILSFETPEGVPVSVAFFEAIPMGSSAFFLFWKKPAQSNGILTGYNIYYQEVNGTKVLNMMSRLPQINSPDVFSAKLSGLKSDTKYRLHIKATTKAGEGESYFIERKTRVSGGHVPDVPTFTWSKLPIENGFATVKVDWVVNPNGKPGSHFYVKYRVHGEPTFQCTKPEINENFMEIHELTPNEDYEFKVVAVDGSHETESAIEQVNTYVVDKAIHTVSV